MSADAAAQMEQKLDVTRAMGVLNAAIRAGMFPDGSIPESDADKILQAEQIIELARQAWTVAQEIGTGNVPMYQEVINVLAEAEVFLGIGTPVAEQPSAPPAPVAAGLCGIDDPSRPGIFCGLPPNHGGPHMAEGQTWDNFLPPDATAIPPAQEQTPAQGTGTGDAPSTADPAPVPVQPPTPVHDPPSAPAPAAAAEPTGVEYPQANETWADASGGQWIIEIGGHGPQLQVRSAATGEQTLVPAGFLAQRVYLAPTQEAVPSSSPPQPSSSPQPLPVSPPSIPAGSGPSAAPLAASSPPPSSSSQPASPASSSPPSPSPSATDQQPASATDDDEGDPQYAALLDEVERDWMPTAMPVPMDLESPPEGMPEDLTAVGDLDQRRLHSQFNALQARTRYLFGLENAKAKRIKRLRKSYMKTAMREARGELGKDATLTEVTALAEEHETVKPWIARQERHEDRAEAYKSFFESYSENVTVLSRDWTMRDLEHRGS